jgi:hypothetical protein
MAFENRRPQDLAERVSRRRAARAPATDAWRRETFTLPRAEARVKAREWFDRYPKAAYQTEIEFWRELDDGRIEFTMRRLPTAD